MKCHCPKCGVLIEVNDLLAGRKAACNACRYVLQIPAPARPAAVTIIQPPLPQPVLRAPPPLPTQSRAPTSPISAPSQAPVGAHDGWCCPQCGSEETQSASIIYRGGTSTVKTTSRHRAVTFTPSGHLMPVVGSSNTEGVQQTQLAAMAAPPARRNKAAAIWGGLVAGIVLSIFLPPCGLPLAALTIVAGVITSIQDSKFNREVWPGLHAEWERKWMCHRCGHVFLK